jgi:hypothetical protein
MTRQQHSDERPNSIYKLVCNYLSSKLSRRKYLYWHYGSNHLDLVAAIRSEISRFIILDRRLPEFVVFLGVQPDAGRHAQKIRGEQ